MGVSESVTDLLAVQLKLLDAVEKSDPEPLPLHVLVHNREWLAEEMPDGDAVVLPLLVFVALAETEKEGVGLSLPETVPVFEDDREEDKEELRESVPLRDKVPDAVHVIDLLLVGVGLRLALNEETEAFAVRELELDPVAAVVATVPGELLVEPFFEGLIVEVMLPLWGDENELVMDHDTLALAEELPLPLADRERRDTARGRHCHTQRGLRRAAGLR